MPFSNAILWNKTTHLSIAKIFGFVLQTVKFSNICKLFHVKTARVLSYLSQYRNGLGKKSYHMYYYGGVLLHVDIASKAVVQITFYIHLNKCRFLSILLPAFIAVFKCLYRFCGFNYQCCCKMLDYLFCKILDQGTVLSKLFFCHHMFCIYTCFICILM